MSKNKFFFLLVISLCFACKESLDYKFQNNEQMVVVCQGIDAKLAKEALFSFEEDILLFNNKLGINQGNMNKQFAYASFIYNGALGNANYKDIVSLHSLKVLEELKKETLWDYEKEGSRLDYNSEFVTCLISNIKSKIIKNLILNLKEANSLSPKVMADVYRKNIREVENDNNLAMFLALETYYQYLLEMDLSKIESSNE